MSKNRLGNQHKARNKRGSAIFIIVKEESEAKQLYTSGLWFGGADKVVEKYWEAEPSLVYITGYGIGYK